MWLSGALWQPQHFSGWEKQHTETSWWWWWDSHEDGSSVQAEGGNVIYRTPTQLSHRLFLIKEQIYRWDDIVHLIWRESLSVRRGDDKCILYCWAYLTDYVITLPGVEILRPGLQNVRETDGEISKGDYAVGPDHRKSRALQHRKHEPDVFFTHRWADENSQY